MCSSKFNLLGGGGAPQLSSRNSKFPINWQLNSYLMTEINSSTRHFTVFLPIITSPQCDILIRLTFDRLVSLQKYWHTLEKHCQWHTARKLCRDLQYWVVLLSKMLLWFNIFWISQTMEFDCLWSGLIFLQMYKQLYKNCCSKNLAFSLRVNQSLQWVRAQQCQHRLEYKHLFLDVLSTPMAFLTCDSTLCSLNASQVVVLYVSHWITTTPWRVDAIVSPLQMKKWDFSISL